LNKFKIEIIDLKGVRLSEEAANIKGSGKGFAGSASYEDYVKNKVVESEKEIGVLTT
jgi:hypothetical protein